MQTINFYNLQHEILPGMLYPQKKDYGEIIFNFIFRVVPLQRKILL